MPESRAPPAAITGPITRPHLGPACSNRSPVPSPGSPPSLALPRTRAPRCVLDTARAGSCAHFARFSPAVRDRSCLPHGGYAPRRTAQHCAHHCARQSRAVASTPSAPKCRGATPRPNPPRPTHPPHPIAPVGHDAVASNSRRPPPRRPGPCLLLADRALLPRLVPAVFAASRPAPAVPTRAGAVVLRARHSADPARARFTDSARALSRPAPARSPARRHRRARWRRRPPQRQPACRAPASR